MPLCWDTTDGILQNPADGEMGGTDPLQAETEADDAAAAVAVAVRG